MAFPTIADADTKTGTVTANSTSWTLTYPTNIAAGDLLIAMVASDGDQTTHGTWPSGWITDEASPGATSLIIAAKKAVGSETGNFSVTGLASEQGAWRVVRIPAATWEGTLGPALTSPDNAIVAGGTAI